MRQCWHYKEYPIICLLFEVVSSICLMLLTIKYSHDSLLEQLSVVSWSCCCQDVTRDSLTMSSGDSNSIIIINNSHDTIIEDDTDHDSMVSQSGASYVTNVTVSNMCLCCTGQQARRCSVNIGESTSREIVY